MNFRTLRRLPYFLAGSVLALLVGCELLGETRAGEVFQRLEWITYDWRARHAAKRKAEVSPHLAMLAISDGTLEAMEDKLGSGYPFPRWVHGVALKELAAQGAQGVAYDVFFLASRPDDRLPGQGQGAQRGASDAFFAQEMKRSGNVWLGLPRDTTKDEGLHPPAPVFRDAAAGMGHCLALLDTDGISRRVLPFYDDAELGRVWLLGLAIAARRLGYDLARAEVGSRGIRVPDAEGQIHEIPLDGDGRLVIRWAADVTDRRAIRHQNLENVMASAAVRAKAGREPPDIFADRLVLVGSTGLNPAISDAGPSPLGSATPLVAIHFNAANSLLTGNFVRTLPLPGRLAILLVLTPLVAAASWKLRVVWATLFNLLVGLAYLGVSLWAYSSAGWWLPVALPVFGVVAVTYLLMVGFRFYFERCERRRVRGVFRQMISPDTLDLLLAQPHVSWEPEERVMTVCFADVRDFTALSGHPDGEEAPGGGDREVLEAVNAYLGTVAETLMEHGATIDKYMGDCVMAFWNAPLDNPSHAADAVRGAIAAQRALARLERHRAAENEAIQRRNGERARGQRAGERERPLLLLSLGTGLNTGVMTVGFMGSERRLSNYTVFGREVNLASRLEGISGRGTILASSATVEAALRQDPGLAAAFREAGEAELRGLADPVSISEVIWREDEINS